ncbi:hypothetical protein TNCV_1770771 [Trichonephila clavipes]|nr:hypothetical protein TNCV_1770771 [Trichonephila clavipes]
MILNFGQVTRTAPELALPSKSPSNKDFEPLKCPSTSFVLSGTMTQTCILNEYKHAARLPSPAIECDGRPSSRRPRLKTAHALIWQQSSCSSSSVLAFSCLCVWIPAKTSIIPAPVAALVWGLTRDFRKGSRQKIKCKEKMETFPHRYSYSIL